MTDYEKAQLRLQAFQALRSYGTTDEEGGFKSWNLDETKIEAERLVRWAAGKDDPR
jgi:hypothetical protein